MPDPQKLIPTKRLIEIAQASGFDFGRGDANNRLRYWTKIGLIPHALRKKIGQNEFTEGHYPYYTLNLLRQIQLFKKTGFDNEEIKRRMKKELAKYVVKEAGVEIRKPKKWEIGLGTKTLELPKKLTIATLCFIVIALISLWVGLTPSGQAKFNQLKTDFGKYLAQLIEPYLLHLVSPVPEEEKVAGVKAAPAGGLLSPLASENMISNSSFEAGNLYAEPKGWGFIGQSGSFNTQVSLESVRTGTKALKINDPACSPLYNKSGCQLGISQPTTKTINGRDYLFTVYVRSHNLVGSPKLRLMLLGGEGQDRYQDFSLPTRTKPEYSDWQQFKTIFKNAPLNYYPAIEVLDYQGGTVYLEDVGFYETVAASTVIADFNLPSTSEASTVSSAESVSEDFTSEVSLTGLSSITVTEQANTRLGDGSILADSSSNLYPLGGTLGPGSLGIDSHRFGGLYLTHASIDGNGNIDSDGTLTVRDKFVADHNLQLGSDSNDSLDVRAELISDLIPDADNQYDLGSSARQWAEVHVNALTAGSATMGGNITMPDDSWIGLGAAKGRIEFDDQGTDEINILSANVGIGTATPGKKLDVVGGDIRSDADLHGGDLYLGYDDGSATLTTTDTNEDLTLDPNGTGDLYFHGSTYQLSDTGDLTLGGRITFENAAYIQNETNGTLYFNEPTIQFAASTSIDIDSPTLSLATQATDFDIIDNTSSALTISQSTDEYLNITTTDTTTSFSLNLPVAGSTSTTANLFISNLAKTINLGTGTAADTINIGTGGTNADDINLGGLATSTIDILGVTKLGDGGTTNYAQFSATGDLTFVGSADTITGPGTTLTLTNASANIALQTTTSGDITATTGASTGLFNVLTGNLKVGNATPTYTLDGEDAYIAGNLEVDGNVYLGDSTADSLTVSGYVTSNLIPNPGSQYTLGNTDRRWKEVWTDDMTVTNLYVSSTNVAGTTSNAFTVNSDNVSEDDESSSFTWERGGPATNVSLTWNKTDKQIELNAPLEISQDSSIANSGTAALIVNQIQNQDIFTASASGTPKFVITNDGNVGIGTTGPSQKLHVEGQCVTGDSELITEDGQVLRVDEVKGGEKVYSLNQETGKLVPDKILALLDMGVKPVYKLTTENGKTIETTGNHPYLVRKNQNQLDRLFEIIPNQNNSNQSHNQSNNTQQRNHKSSPSLFNKEIKDESNNTANDDRRIIGVFEIPFNHDLTPLTNDKENIANKIVISKPESINEANFERVSGLTNNGEITPAVNQAAEILPKISEACLSCPTDNFATKTNLSDKQSLVNPSTSSGEWTKVIYLQPGMEIAVAGEAANFYPAPNGAGASPAGDTPPRNTSEASAMSSAESVKSADTSEVKELAEVKEAAFLGGGAKWEKIISIEYVGEKQVWDLSIENTHNFVANGIIAHNTYINSSATTGTSLDIDANSLTSGTALALASTATSFNGELLTLTKTGASGSTAFTSDIANLTYSQTFDGGVGLDSTGNVLDISRAITLNNVGNTHTISGALVTLSDSGTQTAGTLTHTANVLLVDQNYSSSSGNVLAIENAGTGSGLALSSSSTGVLATLDSTGAVTTADGILIRATNASGVITDAIDVSDAEIVNAINVGANTITGTAAAIDFSEFDVSSATGSITINDDGDLGQISIEGTVLDINSLDFVGAGLFTSGAGNNLTFTPGTTGDLIFSTDADTVATFDGSAEGTANVTLTKGDLTISDGDLILSGGEIAATADDTTGTSFSFTGVSTTGDVLGITANSLTSGTALALASTATSFDGELLTLSKSASGGSTAFTSDIANLTYSQTFDGGVGLDSTGNVLDISRAITLNNVGNTHTISGALVTLSDSGTQTAGTLTHTANVLDITQNYTSSSGTALYVKNYGGASSTSFRVDDASGDTSPFLIDASGNVGIGTTGPATKLDVTGLTINTDADGTVMAANFTGSLTKNDANAYTFAGLQIKPTLNTGASNANTTFNALSIDTTNTGVTGLTTNLLKAAYGGSQKFLVDSSGNLTIAGTSVGASSATVTASTFSGSGASLTSIPETAITDGAILARVASAETITGDWDIGDGTLQIPNSVSLPASCEIGDTYMDTDATSGQRLYLCESANTWVQQGGGSSLWTDGGTTTYLTSTTDDLALGGTGSTAPFFMDVSTGNLSVDGTFTFGDGTTATDKTLFADDGSASKPYLRFNESTDLWVVNQGKFSATPDQNLGREFTINYNSGASEKTWTTPYRKNIELSYGSTTTVNLSAGNIRLNSTWYSFSTSGTYGNAVNGVLTPTQTMGQVFAVCAEEVTGALQINMYKMMENTPATDIYKWDEAGYYLADHNTSGRCQPTSSNHTSILLGYFSIGKVYAATGTATQVLQYSVVNNDNLNGKTLTAGIPLPNQVFVPYRGFAVDLYEAQVCAQAGALGTADRCSGTDWGDADGNAHSGNVVATRSKYNVFPSRGNGNWADGLTYHDFIWAGETIGKRLPTDAEWSSAAQYGLTRSLATGTTANMPKGNNGVGGDYDGTDPEETGGTTANQDIYSVLGLADLNGNLWEYVDDSVYWASGTASSQFGSDSQRGGVVVRGGHWGNTTVAGVFARDTDWATYGETSTAARLAR